jgi:hypothetical protein
MQSTVLEKVEIIFLMKNSYIVAPILMMTMMQREKHGDFTSQMHINLSAVAINEIINVGQIVIS